jgi:signal transduction histidine kinase
MQSETETEPSREICIPLASGSGPVSGPSGPPPGGSDADDEDTVDCAEFERVLTGIASRLSNVADRRFDEILIDCLRTLVEFLKCDRGTLMAFSEHGSRFQATHSWAVAGVAAAANDVRLNAQTPWFTHQIRSGHIVNLTSTTDLPAAATNERTYLLHSDLKSILAIPLLMEGTVIGALSFASCSRQRRWSRGLVTHLRLTGEILALGIRRHQYAQGLRAIAHTVGSVLPASAATDNRAVEHSRDRALRLMQAEHQERRRMGQVLHEDVMQILSAVGMFVRAGTSGESTSPTISKAFALLEDAIQKLRKLTLELRPQAVCEMTLADGIHWLAEQVHQRYDLEVDCRIADDIGPVSNDLRCFLYDSARKLLENVALHAACQRATIEIRRGGTDPIQLTVSDAGCGFDPDSLQDLTSTAFGLFSIHEQLGLLGGTLEVTSAPGAGTRVVVTVPVGDSS